MEESQEADVLWPEEDHQRRPTTVVKCRGHCDPHPSHDAKESAPVAIPTRSTETGHRSWTLEYFSDRDGDDGNDWDEEGGAEFGKEMVPPHVIVARRLSGKMAFSVCTGQGRTLKGRDLSQVRNSILRLTGFLEG